MNTGENELEVIQNAVRAFWSNQKFKSATDVIDATKKGTVYKYCNRTIAKFVPSKGIVYIENKCLEADKELLARFQSLCPFLTFDMLDDEYLTINGSFWAGEELAVASVTQKITQKNLADCIVKWTAGKLLDSEEVGLMQYLIDHGVMDMYEELETRAKELIKAGKCKEKKGCK